EPGEPDCNVLASMCCTANVLTLCQDERHRASGFVRTRREASGVSLQSRALSKETVFEVERTKDYGSLPYAGGIKEEVVADEPHDAQRKSPSACLPFREMDRVELHTLNKGYRPVPSD
ncbi:hypothetical protein KUCAC02_037127, partial [Chaenocephalus aceratus]